MVFPFLREADAGNDPYAPQRKRFDFFFALFSAN